MEKPLHYACGIVVAAACVLWSGPSILRADDVSADQPRLPVPSNVAQRKASKQVSEVFRDDLIKTEQPEALAAQAKRLLKAGEETTDDPTTRYVLLTKAIDAAAGAGDVQTVENAAGALSRGYLIDGLKTQGDALALAAKNARQTNDQKLFVQYGESIVEQAMNADRYTLAKQLDSLVLTIAKKVGDAPAARYAADLTKEIGALESAFGKMKAAEVTLKDAPTDPGANLVAGTFLCLMKGDWVTGLPFLARGNDSTLKDLALKDLAIPSAPEEQMALAGGWWNWAEKETGIAREQARLHAADWYQKAAPALTGLAKTMADKRACEAGLERLVGRWHVTYANKHWSEYLISLDGTVTVVGSSYRETGTKLTARFSNGWFWMDIASQGRQERFRRNGSRLSLEHWGNNEFPSVEQSLKADGVRIDPK